MQQRYVSHTQWWPKKQIFKRSIYLELVCDWGQPLYDGLVLSYYILYLPNWLLRCSFTFPGFLFFFFFFFFFFFSSRLPSSPQPIQSLIHSQKQQSNDGKLHFQPRNTTTTTTTKIYIYITTFTNHVLVSNYPLHKMNHQFVTPPYDKPYTPPTADDFELDYECVSCHGAVTGTTDRRVIQYDINTQNTGQDASSIRSTKDGLIFRVCPLCCKSQHLHGPPRFVPTTKSVTKCCFDCPCTDFRRVSRSHNCECGHSGAGHLTQDVVIGGYWTDGKTLEKALKKKIPSTQPTSTTRSPSQSCTSSGCNCTHFQPGRDGTDVHLCECGHYKASHSRSPRLSLWPTNKKKKKLPDITIRWITFALNRTNKRFNDKVIDLGAFEAVAATLQYNWFHECVNTELSSKRLNDLRHDWQISFSKATPRLWSNRSRRLSGLQ